MTNARNPARKTYPLFAGMLLLISVHALGQTSKGADNGKPFQDVQEAVTAEQAELIAAVEAEAAVREAADLALQDQIDAINGTLDELSTLSMTVEELQADVTALGPTIDAMNAQLDDLNADSTANADAIAGLEADLLALDDELNGKLDLLNGERACDEGSALRAIYPDGGFVCEVLSGGSPGALSTTIVTSGLLTVSPRSMPRDKTASCPDGYQMTGGGYEMVNTPNASTHFVMVNNMPKDATTWQITAANPGTQTVRLQIRMVCIH